MARLQREMATGKQAGAPEPPPPPHETIPREPLRAQPPASAKESGPCVPGPKPEWVDRTGKLQGLGISTAGQREADANARADLIKQFEVTVTGKDTSTQTESTEQGFRYSIASEVTETVNLAVSGLSITDRFVDRCSGMYYALAELDQKQAAQAWIHDLGEIAARVDELRKQSQGLQTGGHVLRALSIQLRIMESQELAAQLRRRLVHLNPQVLATAPDSGQAAATRHDLDTLIDAIQIRLHAGDGQTAKFGRALDKPLVARVVSILPSGETAVRGVPVTFTFETGQGTLDPRSVTDQQGYAETKVTRVEPGTSAEVVARLAVDDIAADVPTLLKSRILQRLSAQHARFRIIPPRAQVARTPFDEAVGALAIGLAERMNDSYGAVGVIRDFAENRSKRRLSLSSRIEQSLTSQLVQLKALRVREPSEPSQTGVAKVDQPQAQMRSPQDPTAGQPSVAVSGVYELDPNGSLWIEAKVVRLKDREMEATMPATIPSSALLDEDLRELRNKGRAPAASLFVPSPAPTQSVGEWAEDLWNQRNSEGFRTEIEPLRPSYHVGETAQFRFRTTQDCYLTVLNIGPRGTMTMLLPNFERPTPNLTLVRSNMGWVTFPSEEDGFEFSINPPLGAERVKAICTKTPTKLFENVDLKQGLLQLSDQDRFKLRDIGVSQKALGPEDWSAAQTQVITLEKGQSETRGMRGLRGLGHDSKQ